MSVINPADGGGISKEDDIDYPNVEWTQENTIGDPITTEPRLVKRSKVVYILKHIGKIYMWLCTIAITFLIINSYLYLFGIGG